MARYEMRRKLKLFRAVCFITEYKDKINLMNRFIVLFISFPDYYITNFV